MGKRERGEAMMCQIRLIIKGEMCWWATKMEDEGIVKQEPQKKKRDLNWPGCLETYIYVWLWQMHSVYSFYTMCLRKLLEIYFLCYSCWFYMVLKNKSKMFQFIDSCGVTNKNNNSNNMFSLCFESIHILIIIFKFYVLCELHLHLLLKRTIHFSKALFIKNE